MKISIEKSDGEQLAFENVISFEQFPERESPRIVVYVTTLEDEAEITEKLEFWESVELIISQ